MWREPSPWAFRGVGQSRASFEDLLEGARPLLWRAFVGARGVDGADEATAEALAYGWEHRERVFAMANPVGYLYRVGSTRSTPLKVPPALPGPASVGLPEIEPALIPALLALPEKQRAAVWLVHGCQWSYAEVAEALEIGTSTVGTHVSRALLSLRAELEVAHHG